MKPLKQALVAELTATLGSILPTAPTGALPRGVTHAVEELADSLLRWRASQHRTPRVSTGPGSGSESDALARLMDGQLHEDEQTPTPDPPAVAEPAPVSVSAQALSERKRRPRLPQ